MGSDMIMAMQEASANGTTLFGLNHHAAPAQRHQVQRVQGHTHDLGDILHTSTLELPQVRQTYSVLGMQPIGQWGFTHGINEHRVVMGVTHWRSRMANDQQVLSGSDVVRLTLERSRSAHHAVEVLTGLIERHGQGATEDNDNPAHQQQQDDHIFLIADRDESYVLEATGKYWALLECHDTRVVTNTAMIHQDWRRLAPGLADFVIEQGWWLDDGSKIDFVRCLSENSEQARAAQRRWGRASLALAQQHGAIDLHFLRRMLMEHYENNLELLPDTFTSSLATSFLVDLQKNDQPIVVWISFGIPRVAVYFPICLIGELPAVWVAEHDEGQGTIESRTREMEELTQGNPRDRSKLTLALERLQARFDLDVEEFLARAHDGGNPLMLAHLATDMMHRHAELFDKEFKRLFNIEEKMTQPVYAVEEVFFA